MSAASRRGGGGARGRFPYEVPAANALLAFEAAARLGSITLAAEERGTSHSAVSRHIRALEVGFGVKLFERRGRGVALTRSGEVYFAAVQDGLETLTDAGRKLAEGRLGIRIGCTLEISSLMLQPVFPALKRTLGNGVAARIVVYDDELLPLLARPRLDIVFEARATAHPDPLAVPVLDEEIVPVAAPSVARRHADVLGGDPRAWTDVPRLDIGRGNPGWATWDTWFGAHGCAVPPGPVDVYENYLNLLRAAEEGEGIALGWNGFLSDYLGTGRLVAVRDEWLRTDVVMYAVPTASGRRKPAVRRFLAEIAGFVGALRVSRVVLRRPPARPDHEFASL